MNRFVPGNLKSSNASSTPATDGERVYVLFGDKENYLVAAYDFAGELLRRRSLGAFESQHGVGVSPIVVGDMLIVCNDQDGPSSILAARQENRSDSLGDSPNLPRAVHFVFHPIGLA